jgi:hypothetical protein
VEKIVAIARFLALLALGEMVLLGYFFLPFRSLIGYAHYLMIVFGIFMTGCIVADLVESCAKRNRSLRRDLRRVQVLCGRTQRQIAEIYGCVEGTKKLEILNHEPQG